MDIDQSEQGSLSAYSGFIVSLYQLLIMLVLPLILMIVCYSRVIKELWLSTKQITMMTRDGSNSPQQQQQQQQQQQSSTGGAQRAAAGWGSRSPSLNTISGRVNRSRHIVKTVNKASTYGHRSGDGAKNARKQVQTTYNYKKWKSIWSQKLLLGHKNADFGRSAVPFLLGSETITQHFNQMGSVKFRYNRLPVTNRFQPSTIRPFLFESFYLRVNIWKSDSIYSSFFLSLSHLLSSFMSTNFRRMIMRTCNRRRRCCRISCTCCCNSGEDTVNGIIRPHSSK